MDGFFCIHDFIIMNKLCAVLIPEEMKIATVGLSVVQRTCGTCAHRHMADQRGAANAAVFLYAECVL